MRKRELLRVLLLIFIVIMAGCLSSAKPHKGGLSVPWKPDGVIEPGEYQYNLSAEDFSVFFRTENGTPFVGMKARTRGWLAVGFGGGPGMKRTDITIAYVLPKGTVKMSDGYSTGFVGSYNPDVTHGGKYDIDAYGGCEGGDLTVVEFSRPLRTGIPTTSRCQLEKSSASSGPMGLRMTSSQSIVKQESFTLGWEVMRVDHCL